MATPTAAPWTPEVTATRAFTSAAALQAMRDDCTVFGPSTLREVVKQRNRGENTPALREAMRTLLANPRGPKADAALKELAALRGRPLDKLKAEYARFQELKQAAAARGYVAEPLNEATNGDPTAHPTYMGSTNQLRYGAMVGNVVGVDPVFGAMLNPTGGLIGPGNVSVEGGDSAMAYHAITHDAGGYLFNAQGTGPGYDYLRAEKRDTTSPLSGLRSGIKYWCKETGAKDLSTLAEVTVTDAFVAGIDTLQASWKSMKNAF